MDHTGMELEQRIQMMMNQSRDIYFTEYLQDLRSKLHQGKITHAYAASELDRTYYLYQQRMQSHQIEQQQTQTQQMQMQQQQFRNMQMPNAQIVNNMQPVQTEKKNTEFVVGAGVLSIVGALFVLVAFVMLGMTYMNGLLKGLFLYVIALVVLLFSELVINRKMPKLAIGITGMAICGFYLSTVLNYIYLNNINGIAAMFISVLISLATILISRKKDSGIIKIISFGGCYISLLPVTHYLFGRPEIADMLSKADITIRFLVLVGIIIIVNIMTICLPVKKMQNAVHITHLVANSLFTIILLSIVVVDIDKLYLMLFAVCMFLIQGFIFIKMQKWCAVYIVAEGFILLTVFAESIKIGEQWRLHSVMGALLTACILLYVLLQKSKYKWIPYWMFLGMSYLVYGIPHKAEFSENYIYIRLVILLVIFLVTKCLSGIKILRSSEVVFTCLTAFAAIYTFTLQDLTIAFCYLGAFLLSLFFVKNWKSLYEEIVMVLFECFVYINFKDDITLAVLTGILFIGVILFNYISYLRDNQTIIYNYINLGLIACLYLGLTFNHDIITYIIMLLLGIAFVILTFREKFGMNFKYKNLIIVLFLCYMTFVCNIQIPVIKSIILMIIAIGTVAVGFILRNKSIRICGLVLSLVVCFKIALFDFAKSPSTEKIVLFLVVGIIALAISGIYIALEKKVE